MLRVDFDLFAQPAHIHIHTSRRDESLSSPHPIEQLIAREDAVRSGRKKVEKTELKRAHRHGLPRTRDTISGRIDAQSADFKRLLGRDPGLGTPQKRLDAS